jgi:hypothetical protein
VSAASATDGFQAQSQASQFDDPFGDADPCPAVVEDAGANHVTITGGCTTADGVAIEGSIELDNPLGWGELEYDFGSASTYDYIGFAIVQSGSRFAFDGTLSLTPGYQPLDMDITVDSFGMIVRSDIFMDCDGTTCKVTNSGLELVGVGGALVSGQVSVSGQTVGGSFTLRGEDTVAVTIADNCTSWVIEGTDRAFDPCQ